MTFREFTPLATPIRPPPAQFAAGLAGTARSGVTLDDRGPDGAGPSNALVLTIKRPRS